MYDKDRLIDAIWNAPQKCTGLNFTQHGGQQWSRQRLDGSDSARPDRTTIKRGTTKDGEPTIWVNYNGGEYPAGQTIWAFLHWLWGTNEHYEVLERVAELYGIEETPDTDGDAAAEQKARRQRRKGETAVRNDAARCILKALTLEQYNGTAVAYLNGRGLQPSARLGAYSTEVRAAIVKTIQKDCPAMGVAQIEEALRRYFPTAHKDYTDNPQGVWRDYADAYQLAAPYYNGTGNVAGFWLRCTSAEQPTYTDKEGAVMTMPKYIYSREMPKGGYCGTLRHDVPVVLVEGMLDAEAIRQAGDAAAEAGDGQQAAEFANVMAMGGQTLTGLNDDDEAKNQIKTLQRYGTKQLIYLPDCEYKPVKTPENAIIGYEDNPTPTATLNAIKQLLPYLTGRSDGDGFTSLRIGNMTTEESQRKHAKIDAADYLRKYGAGCFAGVLHDAETWYEYELRAAVVRNAGNPDALRADATTIYDRIGSPAERQNLQTKITTATGGYLSALKAAGVNAAALRQIDKNGANSTRAARMAEVVGEMQRAKTAERMGELLTKATRIQNAETYDDFAAQANATRQQLHRAVQQKPDALQTPWSLYAPQPKDVPPYAFRKISFSPSAVSVIAAPTNHGKTLVLLQTAIKLAQQTGKRYYYLSVENDAEQLYVRAVTAYMGAAWEGAKQTGTNGTGRYDVTNPRAVVREYIKAEDCPRTLFSRDAGLIDIGRYIDAYWREVAPQLRLIRTTADIEAIINNVTAEVEACNNNGIPVGGVFVDYLQLLHAPAARTHSRTDEVKAVCDRLNDLAKETKLPVIVAAQFNRDATKNTGDKLDGVEMANIAESAGIENIAEDCYLVWQIDKIRQRDYLKPQKDGTETFYVDEGKERSRRCFKDFKDWETLRRGYLYVENLKARDYGTGGYCLLPFSGAAGCIISDESVA